MYSFSLAFATKQTNVAGKKHTHTFDVMKTLTRKRGRGEKKKHEPEPTE